MENKTHTQDTTHHSNQLFLTGAILCANLDYTGLLDYAVKAAVGGLIWLGIKLGADYLSMKIRKK